MEIIIEALDTRKDMIEYISQELFKNIDIAPGEVRKVKMSLDIKSAAYIDVEKHINDGKPSLTCTWVELGESTVYENISCEAKQLVEDVTNMLTAQYEKFDKKKEDFELKCYHAYQLDWMMSHGFTIDDVMNALKQSLMDQIDSDNEVIESGKRMNLFFQCAEEEFLNESGFGEGSMYTCLGEFLDHEYMDIDYMKHLLNSLPEKEEMTYLYEYYTSYRLSVVPDLQVETEAGIINVYKNSDSGNPGVQVLLQPAAYEDEIDVAGVSVYKEPGYRTKDNEGDMDVVIHSYGDAFDENYTHKEIIRRDDVISALGIAAHI